MTIIVGGRSCKVGSDQSIYQPPRDHANDGMAFLIFKATEGNGYHDPAYHAHVAKADAAGKTHGAYHFARPSGLGYADGVAEAQVLLAALAPTESFVMLDLEETVLSAHETAQFAVGFLRTCAADPRFRRREQRVTYVGKWFNYEHTAAIADLSVLCIPSYTAGYQPDPDPTKIPLPAWSTDLWPEGWALWQYSSSGTVAGVHPVDMDVCTSQWLAAVTGQPVTPPEPFPEPERTVMAQPVYVPPTGHEHVLVPAPGTPNGFGWTYIGTPEILHQLALAGVVELARIIELGKGAGQGGDPNAVDVYDATWEAFPVIDGPDARS